MGATPFLVTNAASVSLALRLGRPRADHAALLDQLPGLPDLQAAWLLLLYCASARALRSARPRSTPQPRFGHLGRIVCLPSPSGRPTSSPLVPSARLRFSALCDARRRLCDLGCDPPPWASITREGPPEPVLDESPWKTGPGGGNVPPPALSMTASPLGSRAGSRLPRVPSFCPSLAPSLPVSSLLSLLPRSCRLSPRSFACSSSGACSSPCLLGLPRVRAGEL